MDDRHVLAAAIVGRADAIVTFNLKDFPAQVMKQYNVEAIHPDDFIADQLALRPLDAVAAIKTLRARLTRPPLSAAQFITTLESILLPQTAAALREAEPLI